LDLIKSFEAEVLKPDAFPGVNTSTECKFSYFISINYMEN